ncbi:MAG TPA: SigB/SigF/SigG family RNA polymerase sigma factor [Pseudonocardiaceae bacterium]|jgi:RNA polymerase sigma-B factor
MAPQQRAHETGYDHLLPLFRRLADPSLSEHDRRRLRDDIVAGHLPLAEHIAQKYRHRGQSMEDLRQVARLGLIGAVDRFNPDRGTDFVAFAVPTIMGEVRRYFRDSTWMVQVPRPMKELTRSISNAVAALTAETGNAPRPKQIAARLGISLEAVYEGLQASMAYQTSSLDIPAVRPGDDPRERGQLGVVDPGLDLVENRQTLRLALAGLPRRQAEIVHLRFFEEMTQDDIAARIGISQVHVSRLLAGAVAQLRSAFIPGS